MSDKEDDDVQEYLAKLESAIRIQIEKGLSKTDIMVTTQKSRFYKWGCWIVYGHLGSTTGICLRCGKRVDVNKVPTVIGKIKTNDK